MSALVVCCGLVLQSCGGDDSGNDTTPVGGAGAGGAGAASATGGGGSGGWATGGTSGAGGSGAGTPIATCPSTTASTLPTLDDERATYTAWGWTWSPAAEPSYPSEPGYEVLDPDIHGDTEGDDLWSYLFAYQRTQQNGYLDRAKAWAKYFKEDYRACVGGSSYNFCYDRDAFGLDHMWGWGLIAWASAMNDADALTEAEALGGVLEELYGPNTTYGCLPSSACVGYGPRQAGRHLLLMTRLAEATGQQKWIDLRDRIIDLIMNAPEWDPTYGTYFLGDYVTNTLLGDGAYAAGARLQSPFMIGVLGEALDAAYRATGRADLRDRLVAIAYYVDEYGLDPDYGYTGSWFGIVDGKIFHNYGAAQPVTFWDPAYTTSLVNTLVRGCIYAGDPVLCNRAKHFFGRGNRGLYGEPTTTAVGPTEVHHFVDTQFASSTGNMYFAFNKGELQYTYLAFDPCVRGLYAEGP